MKAHFDKLFKKSNTEDDEEKKRRILLYIIIIIIILLSLITSCSCTSNFFGKIGDLFRKEDSFNITDETDDKEVHKNQELQFDENNVEMALSDARTKISFSYQNISPETFTCSTSDTEIATCYVSNNYVVVIPKKDGKVTVTLQTTVNGIIYEASTEVTIKDANRYINLSSKNGTINLAYTKYKNIPYSLIGLTGTIEVTSSDESIATATASNGILKITANKTGRVTITLTLTYNNITYTAKYTLNVIDDKTKPANGDGSSGSGSHGGGSSEKPTTPNNPTNPSNPTDPSNPEEPSKPGEDDPKPSTPVYTVTLTKIYPDGIYYLEDYTKENPYYLKFEVRKDGVLTNEDVSIKTSDNITAEIVEINGEKFIKITPKPGVVAKDTVSITIESHEVSASTTIDFKIHDYNISITPTEYKLGYTDEGGEREFIIQIGNLFKEALKVTKEGDSLIICSNDNKTCVYVTVPEEYQDLISISYGSTSLEATSSLPIKVSVKKEALSMDLSDILAYINVSATSFGQTILVNNKEEENVKIEFVKSYTIRLHASYGDIKGHFSNGETLISIPIGVNDTFALEGYKAYRYSDEGNCKYYPIESYNTKMDGTGTSYTLQDVLQNITEDIDLYAIYSKELEDITVNPEIKKLYITDIDLFHNEEYKDEKMIYPGVSGSYVMTFYNNTSSDIVIEGMTLEEDTICIENQGCLNMGYTIKYAAPLDKNYTYYYGSEKGHTILNQSAVMKNNYATNRNLNTEKIAFGSGIPVSQGNGVEISLLWEWVSTDNKADTAVGIFANEHADGINDLYKLTISLDFAKNTCELPKTE